MGKSHQKRRLLLLAIHAGCFSPPSPPPHPFLLWLASKMSFPIPIPRLRFLVQFLLLYFFRSAMGQNLLNPGNPEPKIWLAQGHLRQQELLAFTQRLAADPYDGDILVGQPYSLVLAMDVLDRWDFFVESCSCNAQPAFLQAGSVCPRRSSSSAHWVDVQEFRLGQLKFVVIHFLAPEPVLRLQCQTRVVQCCGCCDNFCDRIPHLEPFPSFPVPLSCVYPIFTPPPPPAVLPQLPARGSVGVGCWLPLAAVSACPMALGLPNWLLALLLGLLLLMALLCLCCLLAGCLLWAGGGSRDRIWPGRRKAEVHPLPPPPPTIIASSPPTPRTPAVFTVSKSAQTNPLPLPVPVPVPDYEKQQQQKYCQQPQQQSDFFRNHQQQQQQQVQHECFEHHAPIPLKESPWHWGRTTEETETEEREWVERVEERVLEERRLEGEVEAAHYENWNRKVHQPRSQQQRQTQPPEQRGWTRFGTEPPVHSEEMDRFQWRTTSPDGTQREVDERRTAQWQQQRTAF